MRIHSQAVDLEIFDARGSEYTKIILKPGMQANKSA
jgi:hypothetical protein